MFVSHRVIFPMPPSSLIFSLSTCLGRVEQLCRLCSAGGEGGGRSMSLGVRDDRDGGGFHVPVGLLARLADAQQLACTPSGCVFTTSSAREGVLPRMLREVQRSHGCNPGPTILTALQVLATRVECKRLMSSAKRAGMPQLAGIGFFYFFLTFVCSTTPLQRR